MFSLSPDGAHSDESTPDTSQAIYAEFDDDFEDEELAAPIGTCTAMYNFPGTPRDSFVCMRIMFRQGLADTVMVD